MAHEPAADDALTREIEELRDQLAGARGDYARARDEQEAVRHDLQRLQETLRAFDAALVLPEPEPDA
jgi:molecular chaperone GrpE (heat shock protein)